MKTIFVVYGHTNDYGHEPFDWNVCAYTNEKEAKKHVKVLNEWLMQNNCYIESFNIPYEATKGLFKCPHDLNFQVGSDGTIYKWKTMECFDEFGK